MIVRRPEMRDRLAEVLAMLTNKPSNDTPIIVAETVEIDINAVDELDAQEPKRILKSIKDDE